jgi:WD40 repeat protein
VYFKNHAFLKNFRVSDTDVKDVKIAKDESFIVGCSDNGTVKSWSLKTGEELYCKRVHKSVIWSICLFKNDTMLVTGGTDGRINFIDTDTGRIICRMLNFPWDNEMLIAIPPDKYFPKGLFYSTNTKRILVFAEDENGNRDILPQNSRERIAYINKFNCKNLILSRLKSEKNFTLLSEMHLKNQKKITPFFERKFPKFFGLKA